MFRTFEYVLYPMKAQAKYLSNCLRVTRGYYNNSLQERKEAWETEKKSISRRDQQKSLTQKQEFDPELSLVPVIILRGTSLRRIDLAFQAFYRRCKVGEKKVGYPRFKGSNGWNSLVSDNAPDKNPIRGNRIHFPGVGKIKAKIHRPLEGTPKTLALKLKNGRWFAHIGCEDVPVKLLPPTDSAIGIDLGLISYIATADGEKEPNPKPLRDARIKLERAHRRVSKKKKGSNRRRKAVILLAKQYARVANIRREFQIKLARSLIARYGTIYIEALNIKGLAKGFLAKHIHDAGWRSFVHWLRCKAESAGREVIEVDPRGTSQRCSQCDKVVEKKLSDRVHSCPHCGLVIDRDVNAAKNILKLGLSLRRGAPATQGTPPDPRNLPAESGK